MLPNCVVRILEICAPTSTTNEKETNLSVEAIKLNDSVYQLHKPEGDANIQVLFFHGLLLRDSTEMHLSTWQNDDGCIWPKTWLREEFPDAQILVVSYVEGLQKGCAQNFNMHNICENLIHDLMQAGIGQKPHCPVVMVGHSFGGLVIKKLCLQAYKTPIRGSGESDVKNFLENLKGIFYYSTPHRGSDHIDKAEEVLKGPLFKYFKTLSTGAAKLNQKFDNLRNSSYQKWQIEGLGEGCEVESGLFKGCVVVPEASARDGDKFSLESTADHFSICRPKDRTSRRFKYLTTLLHNVEDTMKEEKKRRDEIRKKEEAMALKRTIRVDLQKDVQEKKLVGIEVCLKEIKPRLEKFKTLGLIGMGGVGKTTLAMVVFNEVCHAFEYTCFINDVKSKGVECNLEDLAWKHMHHNGRKVEDTQEWYDLRGKRLLLVLDDILGDRDVTFLFNTAKMCSPGSRFIVTTRDRDKILNCVEDMDSLDIYKVPFLDEETSKELFMTKAFPSKETPKSEVISIMEKIVRKCDGLPLTLTVLGSYLRTKKNNTEMWTQTLNALIQTDGVTPIYEKLWAKLRLSYDSLAEKEKQIFLDATTFFSAKFTYDEFKDDGFAYSLSKGWTLREAKAAWREAYSVNYESCNELLLWQTLVDRDLVSDVREDEQIKIHEQLLSLGRKLAYESDCKIRVWDQTMGHVSTLLKNNESENKEFHALKLADGDTIPDQALYRFKKLRYLEANFSYKVGKPLPSELVLLKCRGLQTLQNILPADLRGHLAVLRLSDVGYLPSFIGQFSSLRIFTSERGELSQIESRQLIPDEIGDLMQLEYLEFSYSDYVQSLPETFGNLSNLRVLRVYECNNLHSLPKSFGLLASLKYLELCFCQSLDALPDSFGNLLALEHLELENCGFVALPDSFGDLSSLEHLQLRYCQSLYRMCDSFGNLSRLKDLEISDCYTLHALPDSFGDLSALVNLRFKGCPFEALRDSFGDLSRLKHLALLNSDKVQSLPETFGNLSSLEHLELRDCQRLHRLCDSFGNLSRLKYLEIHHCHSLNALPDSFANLSALEHLQLKNCPFEALPDSFGDLSRLKHLGIHGCASLSALPDSFWNLLALERLELVGCRFEALPKLFGQLLKLTHLDLMDCDNLASLIPFGQFTELQYLSISGKYDTQYDIIDLDKLPVAIGELKALRHLILLELSVESIPDWIKSMQSLQTLELGQLPFVQDVPSWLGEEHILPLALSDKVFHVQDGHFILAREKTKISAVDKILSFHGKAGRMVENSDYERALQYLSPYNLGDLQPKHQRLLLQERGIVKRFKGDLHGALEDLTTALGVLLEEDDGQGSLYDVWKHRGFVNFLLGNLDRAQHAGVMALKARHLQFKEKRETRGFRDVLPSSLGEEVVSYMHFKLVGLTHPAHIGILRSSNEKLEEKLSVSDFSGALAIWDAVDVDGKVSNLSEWFIFLLHRGTLKRLAGDLHGALGDLSKALEIIGDSEDLTTVYKSLNLSDSFFFECLKQRGFVKYLLRDWNGAHEDGTLALKDPKYESIYTEAEDENRCTYDCWKHPGYVNFLLEALDGAKRDGAMALAPGSNQAMNVAVVVSPSVGEESVRYYRATYPATEACASIGARELNITWGGDGRYWQWCHIHGSRFAEVAYLKQICWLEVNGRWQGYLSPGTYTLSWRLCLSSYEIYLHKMGPVEFSFEATGNVRFTTECYLTQLGAMTSRELSEGQQQPLGYRWDPDSWMELDVGNFTVGSEDLPVEIKFSMKEIKTGSWKRYLCLDGIVIYPSFCVDSRIPLSTLHDSEIDSD